MAIFAHDLTFLAAVIRFLDKSNYAQSKETLAHRGGDIKMAGAQHSRSHWFCRQGEVSDRQLLFSVFCSLGSQLRDWCLLLVGWISLFPLMSLI